MRPRQGARGGGRSINAGRTSRPHRARGRLAGAASPTASLAVAFSLAIGALAGGSSLAAAQTAQDPSEVVLVFDVSDSILDSEDGTNLEFATALEGIADRVVAIAPDLTAGNATVSFVAFAVTARPFPGGCQRLELQGDPAAVSQFEACLRRMAAQYEAGGDAPVKERINTAGTDHVAALVEAAGLLPDLASRSAVIFFTDGQHDPPGPTRDDENVIAKVRPAFEGRTPLAILPVGLGAGAGDFESGLRAIYDEFLRDMEPCEGRAAFAWPEVVFPSGIEAGAAVGVALQEVTCSFTVAPSAPPPPTPTAPPPDAPTGVNVLAGNESVTVQWLAPTAGDVVDYLVRCRPTSGGDWIDSAEGVSTDTETVIGGLEPGTAYDCEVAASDGTSTTAYVAGPSATIVLGVPLAPGQPRVEPLDAAVRVSVDPAGGAPVERYIFECTGGAGQTVQGSGPEASRVVGGLTNGETFQCIAYAENRIGRSAASAASASFTPCAGLFACNPLALPVLSAAVIGLLIAVLVIGGRIYTMRTRIFVTAQVDGGANRPIGWGHVHGLGLDRDEGGWYASFRPIDKAQIRIQYVGKNRFSVQSSAGIRNVHQGDPAPVREGTGATHQLIVRLYRKEPRDLIAAQRAKSQRAKSPPDNADASALGARLDGGGTGPPAE